MNVCCTCYASYSYLLSIPNHRYSHYSHYHCQYHYIIIVTRFVTKIINQQNSLVIIVSMKVYDVMFLPR